MPPVAAPATPAAAPTVAEILGGLRKRGLSITLNEAGDGLRLHGPEQARTSYVRDTLKATKPALLAHLREQREQAETELRETMVEEFGAELVAEGQIVHENLLKPPSSFPLPEVIYHKDPAAFWREWCRPPGGE